MKNLPRLLLFVTAAPILAAFARAGDIPVNGTVAFNNLAYTGADTVVITGGGPGTVTLSGTLPFSLPYQFVFSDSIAATGISTFDDTRRGATFKPAGSDWALVTYAGANNGRRFTVTESATDDVVINLDKLIFEGPGPGAITNNSGVIVSATVNGSDRAHFITITGDVIFRNNNLSAGTRGGAAYMAKNSLKFTGDVVFDSNSGTMNNGSNGGAIIMYSSAQDLIFEKNAVFLNNKVGGVGGAITFSGVGGSDFGSLTMSGTSIFIGNMAGVGSSGTENTGGRGGALLLGATGNINGLATFSGPVWFEGNSVSENGGAVQIFGSTTMTFGGDAIFISNTAGRGMTTGNGGAMSITRGGAAGTGTLSFQGTGTFQGNTAAGYGGALHIELMPFLEFTHDTTFKDNVAGASTTAFDGGAINFTGGTLSLAPESGAAILFEGNWSTRYGGAISSAGDVFLSGGGGVIQFLHNVTGGASANGGALFANGKTITADTGARLVFQGNFAGDTTRTADGGAIRLNNGRLVLSGSALFEHNQATRDGGAISYDASTAFGAATPILDLSGEAVFLDNHANRYGGAIALPHATTANTLHIVATTAGGDGIRFSGNTAKNNGGAIYIHTATGAAVVLDARAADILFENNRQAVTVDATALNTEQIRATGDAGYYTVSGGTPNDIYFSGSDQTLSISASAGLSVSLLSGIANATTAGLVTTVTKTGSGAARFGAVSNINADTTVQAGEFLLVDNATYGRAANTGTFTVQAGAVLGGSGTLRVDTLTLADGAILRAVGTLALNVTNAPSLTRAVLSGAGAITGLASATTSRVTLGAGAHDTPVTLNFGGALTLDNATVNLDVFGGTDSDTFYTTSLTLTGVTAFDFASFVSGTYTLLNASGGITNNGTWLTQVNGQTVTNSRWTSSYSLISGDTVLQAILIKYGSKELTWTTAASSASWDLNTGNWDIPTDGFLTGDAIRFADTTGTVTLTLARAAISQLTATGTGTVTLAGTGGITADASSWDTSEGPAPASILGRLDKTGAGTLLLANTGSNAFAAGVLVNGGTLIVAAPDVLGAVTATNNAALALALPGAATFANTLLGTGTLFKTGDGATTLAAASSAQAAAIVAAGTLAYAQNGAFTLTGNHTTRAGAATALSGSSSLTVGGTFVQENNATLAVTLGIVQPAITAAAASLDGALSITGFNGSVASAASGLADEKFTLLRTTTGTIAGDFATKNLGGASSPVNYHVLAAEKSAGAKDYTLGFALAWTAGPAAAHGGFSIASGTFDADLPLANQTGAFATGWDGKSLDKTGAGTLLLSAQNTLTGTVTISAGTLALAAQNAIATAAAVDVAATAVLTTATTQTLANLTGSGTLAAQTASATFTLASAHDTTFSGLITGAGSLVKTGTSRLTLAGANTFTGGLALDAGILALAHDTAPGTGSLVFAGGTLAAQTAASSALTLANAISLTPGAFAEIDTGAGSLTLSGALTGDTTGTLAKTGDGSLILAADNTAFTAPVFVKTGTLDLAGALGSAINVAANAALELRATAAGGVTLAPGATLLTGAGAAITGNFAPAAGTVLQITPSAGATTGTLAITGTLNLAGDVTLRYNLATAGSPPALTAHDTITAAALTLGGTNTFDFATSLVQGDYLLVNIADGAATLAGFDPAAFVTTVNDADYTAGAGRMSVAYAATATGLHMLASLSASGTLTWNGADDGTWKAGAGGADWDGIDSTFTNGDIVVFDSETAAESTRREITVDATGVLVAGMHVTGTGDYRFIGDGAIHGTDNPAQTTFDVPTGKLIKDGAGTLELANTGGVFFAGGIELLSGTLKTNAAVIGTNATVPGAGAASVITTSAGSVLVFNETAATTTAYTGTVTGASAADIGDVYKTGPGELAIADDAAIHAATFEHQAGTVRGAPRLHAAQYNLHAGALRLAASDTLALTRGFALNATGTLAAAGDTRIRLGAQAAPTAQGRARSPSAPRTSAAPAEAAVSFVHAGLLLIGKAASGPAGNAAFGALTIEGDFAGAGGTIALATVLNAGGAETQTDSLHITGDLLAGDALLRITNDGGIGDNTGTGATDGIKIVSVDGAINGAFTLAAPVTAGVFDYGLVQGDGGFYLQAIAPVPEIPAAGALPGMAALAGQAAFDSVRERLAALRAAPAHEHGGWWLRDVYDETRLKTGPFESSRFHTNLVQFGIDTVFTGENASWTMGVFYTNTDMAGRVAGIRAQDDAKGAGVYVLMQRGRLHASLLLQADDSTWRVFAHDGEFRARGWSNGASLEAGHALAVSPRLGTLEADAALTAQKLTTGSARDPLARKYSFGDGKSLLARAGLRWRRFFDLGGCEWLQPWLRAGASHEFASRYNMSVQDAGAPAHATTYVFENDLRGSQLDLSAGLGWGVTEQFSFNFSLALLTGKTRESCTATGGIRYAW
jgi:outer membrane autotransporter protein